MGTAAGASLYLENKILDHTLHNTAYTPATTVYAGLFNTVDPSGELAITRQAVTFAAASGFSIANSAVVSFGVRTVAVEVWSVGLFDASTGGNLLAHGPLSQGISYAVGETPTIAAGSLSVGVFSIGVGYYATTYWAQKILDHVFRNTVWTTPAAVYLGLFTDSQAQAEVSATGYARQALAVSAASQGSTTNSGVIDFACTASYGSVPTAGIFDASTSGNLLLWAPLDTAISTNAGDTVRFNTTQNIITAAVD